MTTHVTYNTDTDLIFAVDEVIKFIGNGDTLSFVSSQNDKVTATGTNQTVATQSTNGLTIVDHSHGLTLDFLATASGMVVQDFQHDATGKVAFFSSGPVTFAPDNHGGTMATGVGISVDFKGFHDIAALEARVVPAT